MATKYNAYKSIKQGLVHPNILFTAAYIVFSAEICTSSPKHKSRNGIGNGYVATPQVKQPNKMEENSDPAGKKLCDDDSLLDRFLAIDSEEDDALLDDTSTTTPSVERPKDSLAKDALNSSAVDTRSNQGNQQDSDCLIDFSDRNMDGIGASLPIMPVIVNNYNTPDSNGKEDKHTHDAPSPPVEDHTRTPSNGEEDGNRHNESNGNSINKPNPNDPESLRDHIGNNVILNQRRVAVEPCNDGSDHESGNESDDEEDSALDKNQLKNESKKYKKIKALNQEQQRNFNSIADRLFNRGLDTDDENNVCYDGKNNPPEWDNDSSID